MRRAPAGTPAPRTPFILYVVRHRGVIPCAVLGGSECEVICSPFCMQICFLCFTDLQGDSMAWGAVIIYSGGGGGGTDFW